MKIVGEILFLVYEGCIINIYLIYLFEFLGVYGIKDVWEVGVDQFGVIIYWVDFGVDIGQVI